jgi:hypothetical protein
MQTPNNESEEPSPATARSKISVIGRKLGKTISIPVCATFLMNWGEHMKNRII